MKKILNVENLSKKYGNKIGVKNISFKIFENETVSLIGESGCGKTTIAKLIVGLLKKDTGKIEICGKDIDKMTKKEQKDLHKIVQMIFQSPYSSLNPKYRVKDIIAEGIKSQKLLKDEDRINEYILELLNEVGLDKEVLDKYPHQLSGGMCQRVGIARAIAVNPKLIIADECLSALDRITQMQVLNLLEKIKTTRGISFLFITHDISVAEKISDRIILIRSGEIVEENLTKNIFSNPKNNYTKNFIEAVNFLKNEIKK